MLASKEIFKKTLKPIIQEFKDAFSFANAIVMACYLFASFVKGVKFTNLVFFMYY